MFAKKVGSVVGKGAAYIGHGAIRAAELAGQAGKDFVSGTKEGYAAKRDELRAKRAAAAAVAAPVQLEVELVN